MITTYTNNSIGLDISDISDISYIINYDLPNSMNDYVNSLKRVCALGTVLSFISPQENIKNL